MAKKPAKPKAADTPPSLTTPARTAIQDAIAAVPALRSAPEADYCNAVLEALDDVGSGLKMRLEELTAEETDDR